jgi:hypothetical protein
MTEDFKINGTTLKVDKVSTEKFYLTQNKITDNCGCSDCLFYADNFTKQPFEIFKTLKDMGVDLEKNLSSEPTGVWCVRDDNGQLIYCFQVYQVFASLDTLDKTEISYEKHESGYKVDAKFIQSSADRVDIELKFDLPKN